MNVWLTYKCVCNYFFHILHYITLGASNKRAYEKNRDFRPRSRFISEMIQDRIIDQMHTKRLINVLYTFSAHLGGSNFGLIH